MTVVKIVAFAFKIIQMKKMADKVMANPKATQGGVATVVVTVLLMVSQSFGIEMTEEYQSGLVGIVAALGSGYTAWRGFR